MHTLSCKKMFSLSLILTAALLSASLLSAWSGPTATAPAGNVAAPINVGTTDQVKDAGISVNSLAVFGSQYIEEKLGINKTSPVVALHVVGSMILGNGGEVCQAITEGGIRYNSGSKTMEFCNGTEWAAFGGGSGSSQGSTLYTIPGTYTFTVPNYASSLSVELWGGGGGGTGYHHAGGGGTASTFNSSVSAGGGGAGRGGYQPPAGGTGGIASGGTTNQNGSAGSTSGIGGNSPSGGNGGTTGMAPGGVPGGGGAAAMCTDCSSGGGGGGAHVIRTYSVGQLTPGSTITLVVGSGGAGGTTDYSGTGYPNQTSGGAGARGQVNITWQ